ncbi:MAG: HD domain-containing protein [Nanoarchaeota archaeon]|nr:HD domain-containing protein [Nanoarchaeota archaeon]
MNIDEIIQIIKQKPPYSNLSSYIHGKSHAERVLLFATKLAEKLNEKIDMKAVTIAALLHDVGRVDDGLDPNHGNRSAILAEDFLKKNNIECNIELIKRIIRRHCEDDFSEAPVECLIVGDADKLDRFRLRGDPLREEYLELAESLELVDFARKMDNNL